SPVAYARNEVREAAVERILDRVRVLPGVRGAAVATVLPMAGGSATIHFNIEGRPPRGPEDFIMAGYRAVSPGYFETMSIPLRSGRVFDARDKGEPTVVIV